MYSLPLGEDLPFLSFVGGEKSFEFRTPQIAPFSAGNISLMFMIRTRLSEMTL